MHDLRMAAPALGAWGTAAACLVMSSRHALLIVGLAAIVAAFSAHRRELLLVVVAVCVAGMAATCAWRLAAVESSPITRWAAEGRSAVLNVEVRSDARSIGTPGRELVVLDAVVRRATAGAEAVRTRAGVTLFVESAPDDLVVGRRLLVEGRLSPSDDAAEVATVSVTRLEAAEGTAWWWAASQRLRLSVREAVAHAGADPAALVPALVDGDDQRLSERVHEEFRRSGLTHLLAVSGTNLTIVLAAVLLLGRSVGVRHRGLWLIGAVGVAAFVLLARPEPSVVRAAGMGLVGLAAIGYGTRGGMRVLSWAVLGLLFVDPWLARSAGFILSVSATAGILMLAPALARPLAVWMPRWCALAVAVPLAAQLACTPAIVAISDEVSLVAVVANLLAGPLVAPATVAGLLGGLLALVWVPLGQLVGTLAAGCAAWILAVGRHAASLQGAVIDWHAPWWLLVGLCAAVAVAVVCLGSRPAIVIGVCLGLVIGMWRPPQTGWPPEGWIMVACDVGQGDATVLRTSAHEALLVDAGPDDVAVDRCLRALDIRRVRLLVLTHGHADHVGGWAGVVHGRQVDQVAVGPSAGPDTGLPVRAVSRGDSFSIGAVRARVLWPLSRTAVAAAADEDAAANDASVVLQVETAGVTVLVTGDIEPRAQEALLRAETGLGADVIKMPHHGSSRQSEAFFEAVGAQVATISVGAGNSYGHPAPSAMSLLADHAVSAWRTDLDGDIAVVARQGRLFVVTR